MPGDWARARHMPCLGSSHTSLLLPSFPFLGAESSTVLKISLFVYLCACVYICVCVYLCLCVYLSVCMYLSLSLSVHINIGGQECQKLQVVLSCVMWMLGNYPMFPGRAVHTITKPSNQLGFNTLDIFWASPGMCTLARPD